MGQQNQWVQHRSGDGEKYRVVANVDYRDCDHDRQWVVQYAEPPSALCYYLPKSEYGLCDPPEVWEDVTGECEIKYAFNVNDERKSIIYKNPESHLQTDTMHAKQAENYRFRKVDVNFIGSGIQNGCMKRKAFIVERKKS